MTSAAFANDFKEGIQQERVAENWRQRKFSCEMWIDPPHTENEQVTSSDKILMLVSGMLEIHLADQTLRPEVGEEVLIPAGTHYVQRTLGRTTACWLYGYRQT